jgi:hypothetical protein
MKAGRIMKKIPLESTIVGSYKFLFSNIVSIIGTMWFPLVLMFALAGALVWSIVPHDWCQGGFKPEEVKEVVLSHLPMIVSGLFALFIAGMLVRAMITVGILRHAVGEKTSTTFVYFSLGARVWRMVGVALLAVVISVILEIGAVMLFVISNVVLSVIPHAPTAVVALVNFVLTVVVVLVVIYVMLRLFFFLPAVVVAENKIGVGRAWELGKGNVWRMIVVLLAAVIPVYVLAAAACYLTVIPTIVVEAVRHQPQGPDEALAFFKSLWPLLPVLAGIFIVAAIAITGLVLGAIGRAYKAVTAPEEANT